MTHIRPDDIKTVRVQPETLRALRAGERPAEQLVTEVPRASYWQRALPTLTWILAALLFIALTALAALLTYAKH